MYIYPVIRMFASILKPRGGEPQIRQLNPGSIQVVEGHFSPPIGKTDVLKAPKHFPVPVMRYVLREMTLIWEVFGGNDFPKNGATANPKYESFTLIDVFLFMLFILSCFCLAK